MVFALVFFFKMHAKLLSSISSFLQMAFRVKLKLKKECQIGNNNGLWLIYLHCSLGVEISSSKSNGIGIFFEKHKRWMRCKVKNSGVFMTLGQTPKVEKKVWRVLFISCWPVKGSRSKSAISETVKKFLPSFKEKHMVTIFILSFQVCFFLESVLLLLAFALIPCQNTFHAFISLWRIIIESVSWTVLWISVCVWKMHTCYFI